MRNKNFSLYSIPKGKRARDRNKQQSPKAVFPAIASISWVSMIYWKILPVMNLSTAQSATEVKVS